MSRIIYELLFSTVQSVIFSRRFCYIPQFKGFADGLCHSQDFIKKWSQENNDRNEGKSRNFAKCSRSLRGIEDEGTVPGSKIILTLLAWKLFSVFLAQTETIKLYLERVGRGMEGKLELIFLFFVFRPYFIFCRNHIYSLEIPNTIKISWGDLETVTCVWLNV